MVVGSVKKGGKDIKEDARFGDGRIAQEDARSLG